VVEEAPAPSISERMRRALHDSAVRFAKSIAYENLGTVEFIVDADSEEFFFLEVNCRIQVEHPVTEALTGRDLVAMQLRIAAGEPLGLEQRDVTLTGHAVQARLNAEDVAHAFTPSPGTLSLFSIPERDGLRVDTYCLAGASVPPFYDSLLAKLIAHGPDREAAIATLTDALDDTDIEGVETNRTLLITVLGHPDFRAARVSTDWLTRVLA
jgi:acetyl-CoA carboxylase biotin carboxylase subunit